MNNKKFLVYARQEDIFVFDETSRYNGILLVSIFDNEKDAIDWIIKNGNDVCQRCKREQSCYQREYFESSQYVWRSGITQPVILMIIPFENSIEPKKLSMYEISTRRYSTFAFSKSAFQMLMKEHYQYCVTHPIQTELICWWIYYFNFQGHEIVGEEQETIRKIHIHFKCDDEYNEFVKNKDKYIFAKRALGL